MIVKCLQVKPLFQQNNFLSVDTVASHFRFVPLVVVLLLILPTSLSSQADELPTLGNASSNLISIEQEKKLGEAWLRSLRRQVSTFDHPIIEAYFAQTVYNLAPHSEVLDKDFRFVVVDSKALNAFAVPGSIIGINAGLFLHAVSEQEFVSVLAHELAHISQRHYARRLEQQRVSTPLALAGILTSVVIAATAGSEAGMAALASTQAMSVEAQLGFSRQNEEEADRLGIVTLYKSGYDPRAMPMMFERMYRQTRLQGENLPEYLSTHPLSENRIADTRNRATQYPVKPYRDNIEYHICKSIIINHYADSPAAAEKYFNSLIEKGNTSQISGARYGLALALLSSAPEQALSIFNSLLEEYPGHISIALAKAEAEYTAGNVEQASAQLEKLYQRNPSNYPISIKLAEFYMEVLRYAQAEAVLEQVVRNRPDSSLAWYQLAEIYGKTGKIQNVHMARAEYFVLTNRLDNSIEQLNLAKTKSKGDSQKQAVINKRLEEIRKLKEDSPF